MGIGSGDIVFDVYDAVEDVLTEKGHGPRPHDPEGNMATGYGFTFEGMGTFLAAVGGRLDLMGHAFTFEDDFVDDALGLILRDLKVKIAEKTV